MKITIEGESKEIAAFVSELQKQPPQKLFTPQVALKNVAISGNCSKEVEQHLNWYLQYMKPEN